MKINNNYTNSAYRAQSSSNTNNPSFGAAPNVSKARTAFEWIGSKCNIEPNGSLTRSMFFAVSMLFLLGARFVKSRDNDEKREVVTRDVPAVALSVAGAPIMNKAVAYAVTKKSGVPIVTMGDANEPLIKFGKDKVTGEYRYKFGKQGKLLSSAFTSQKQVADWYSELSTADNALVNFSETVNKHGGNLQKVFKRLGFTDKLNAITDAVKNADILEAIKNGKANNTEAFENLETALRAIKNDNRLFKFAEKSQAYVKNAGVLFMAAVLGYFLPHLNIVMTKKKYEGKVDDATLQKKLMRTSPVFRVSSGVLSFHKTSAIKTFKNLLSMAEPTSHFE